MVFIWLIFCIDLLQIVSFTCVQRSTLCTKDKNIISKRDSSVKCSIEWSEMFVYTLQWALDVLLPGIDMFEGMENKEKTQNVTACLCC